MTATALVVAGEPDQPTGGYRYDARMAAELRASGRKITIIGLDGRFPQADATARAALDDALAARPERSLAVIDGLALGSLPAIAERHARRLTLIALVHHPLADEAGLDAAARRRLALSERRALAAVAGVIVTSEFTARRLADYGVDRERLHVVTPGVDAAAAARCANPPARLLCVASLIPRKGHDVLVEALARLRDLDWRCDCVGDCERAPRHAAKIARAVAERGLGGRIRLCGALSFAALADAYADADLFVLPSRYEGYGMVITEALARGLPVVATRGGALADTLPDRAGLKLKAGDAPALAGALRTAMTDAAAYRRLRRGALAARATLAGWPDAAARFARVLAAYDEGLSTPRPHPAARFASGWLALREAADRAARADEPVRAAARYLERRGPEPRVVDLGSGAGANLRYLAPRLPAARWRLVDHDADLLARARTDGAGLRDARGRRLTLATRTADLDTALEAALDDAALVTAAALLDLVSARWLARLVAACARAGAALLCATSVDGRIAFHGRPDADDAPALAALAAHQRGDKGLGPALGADAPQYLITTLAAGGYTVTSAPSDWRLHTADAALAAALIDDWAAAAAAMIPDERRRVSAWARRRSAHVARGAATLTVGHVDVLGVPPA